MSAAAKLLALILLGAAVRSVPAPAEPASPAPATEAAAAPGEVDPALARWIERLDKKHEELEHARARAQAAEVAWRSARHRDYPRGEARAALEKELEEARGALADAEASWPRLLEDARREGVPPGVLRRYQ